MIILNFYWTILIKKLKNKQLNHFIFIYFQKKDYVEKK